VIILVIIYVAMLVVVERLQQTRDVSVIPFEFRGGPFLEVGNIEQTSLRRAAQHFK